jgi:hypothetical protein
VREGEICGKIKAPDFNLQVVDFERLLLTGGADGSRETLQVVENKAAICGSAANCPPKCPHVTLALVSLQEIPMDFAGASWQVAFGSLPQQLALVPHEDRRRSLSLRS